MKNAELAAHQIKKHGRDRYPTVEAQFIKLVEEVGELGKEINKGNRSKAISEAADVALALYNLANKLDFTLDDAIRDTVEHDIRTF